MRRPSRSFTDLTQEAFDAVFGGGTKMTPAEAARALSDAPSREPLPHYARLKPCCHMAERFPCVCEAAYRCSVHGEQHIGTHD